MFYAHSYSDEYEMEIRISPQITSQTTIPCVLMRMYAGLMLCVHVLLLPLQSLKCYK